MATEGPLAIEAPKLNPSYVVNENQHAVVPVPTPGPVVPGKEPNDTITQQLTTSEAGKQEIPPGFQRPTFGTAASSSPPQSSDPAILAVEEQQSQHVDQRCDIEEKKESGSLHMKATKTHAVSSTTNRSILVGDGQGNMRMFRQTKTEVFIITEIYEVLHTEASYSNKRAVTNGEDFEAKATCGEKTVDLCCQSLACDFSKNPFKKDATALKKKQLMNPTRRRGRAKGWTILKGLIFPFVSDVVRDFWVTFQLFFALILLGLSATTFVLVGENYEVFHAVHLAFSVLAAFLAILDSIVSYIQCSACKACISWCRKKAGRERSEDISTQIGTPSDDKQGIDETAKVKNADVEKGPANANDNETSSVSGHSRKRCRKCFKVSRSGLDIARLLLTEFILVPIIFCDMFEVATGKGFSSDVPYHIIGFALIVYDSIGLIVFVFLLCLVIVGRMIRTEQRMHPTQEDINVAQNILNEEGKLSAQQSVSHDYDIDKSIKKNSLMILITLFLHVFGQTHVTMVALVDCLYLPALHLQVTSGI